MTTINNLLENVMAAKSAYDTALKQITEDNIHPLFASVFDQHPKLESFSWNQYTPYFNDGDECVFRVNSDADSLYYNGDSYYDYTEDNEALMKEFENGPGKTIETILNSLGDDILRNIFGDHALITVNRDGTVEVDGYEHE